MTETVRPLSRVLAVELTDIEINEVGGGANTDVYTRPKNVKQIAWDYDGSHGGD